MYKSIQETINKGEGPAKVRGWVYRERKSKKIIFLVLRDVTNIIQCIIKKDSVPEKLWNEAEKLLIESSVEIEGDIVKSNKAPTGYEIVVKDLNIVHLAEPFPITKDQSTEFLLDKRHLWLRSRKLTAILKIKSTITAAIHEFFRIKGYYEFLPPIFQPSQCEGGSTLFEVNYYQDKIYLTQSWQLYAEAAIFALEKIYCVSPAFRAEKSRTSRHLSEFWMAEMEAAWLKLDDVTEIAKEEIKFIIKQVLEKNLDDLQVLNQDIEKLKYYVEKDYPTITYTEAIKVLKEKCKMEVEWGKDLRTIEEEKLMEHFDTPIVVIDYPKEVMAFYKPERKSTDTPGPVALCFDMLAPDGYGEIIGGSERETDINELIKALKKQGEDPANYDWYLDLRKYGSVPHSGYGVGVERVVSWICGLENIKDAIGFPRTMLRKKP
ncbi:MAG: asparagine--tRNA ligase [archaeon]